MNLKHYAQNIIANAKRLAEGLKKEGFTLVSDGTDNHLLLIDVRSIDLTGKVAEKVLDEVGITVNKNTIPFDPAKPICNKRYPYWYSSCYISRLWLRRDG